MNFDIHNDGCYVLKDVYSHDLINEIKTHTKSYFSNPNSKKSEGNLLVNAINIKGFELHHELFKSTKLIEYLNSICGGQAKYCHHYDVRLGNPALNFHQDGGIRHLNQLFVHKGRKGWDDNRLRNHVREKYDLEYSELCGVDNWKEFSNPKNEYNMKHEVRGEKMEVFRLMIYMQDHNKSGGLKVLKGSHRKSKDKCDQEYVPTSMGDVLIFHTSLFHEGTQSSNRGLISSAFGVDNFLTDMHIEGTIGRQQNMNGEQIQNYRLSDDLKNIFDEMGIIY
tara:strand:- start:665 stop:1501 length:837 start_codon:yes stop_codon:yes gene_type:complete